MTSDEATVAVIDLLETAGVPYMIVGSLSSNYYGIARSTKDSDVVLRLGEGQLISQLLRTLGPMFRFDPQMCFETVTNTTRFLLQCLDSEFVIEFFMLSDDPLDQCRFERRRRVTLFERQVWLPTAEDVIVWKLRWFKKGGRRKDLDDARDVLAVQGDKLDWEYIHRWCEPFDTRATLDALRISLQ